MTLHPKVAIYTACDSNVFQGAMACLRSFRNHFPECSFYLVDSGLSSQQRRRAAREFKVVPSSPSRFPWEEDKQSYFFHAYRNNNIEAEYLVYADCDTVALRRDARLLTVPHGKIGTVCESNYPKKFTLKQQFSNFSALYYFNEKPVPLRDKFSRNTGIIAGDRAGWEILLNSLGLMHAEDSKVFEDSCTDQGSVGISIYRSNIDFDLPLELNCPLSATKDCMNPSVIHFTGYRKPWALQRYRPNIYDAGYIDWRANSSWLDFPARHWGHCVYFALRDAKDRIVSSEN
ncbi:MAG: hypothetical protein AAFX40_09900 [Cyanobacteria bacterium J06639_1]